MKRYYIEFEFSGSNEQYDLQSRWFDTKEQAIEWYKTSFDYINDNDMRAYLFVADYDLLTDDYWDEHSIEDITMKCYLR